MHSAIGLRILDSPLGQLRHHCVIRVNNIRRRSEPQLAHQLVGIQRVQTSEFTRPQDELLLADAESILQRPDRTRRHQKIIALEPRPRRSPTLDEIHGDDRIHC